MVGSMTLTAMNHWTLTFAIDEDSDHCDIVATLETGVRKYSGEGRSRRNPDDPAVPRVGEELAVARALHDLANHLTEDAWRMIEGYSKANA